MSTFDAARAANYDQGAEAAIIGHQALYDVVMTVLAPRALRRVLVLGAGTGMETLMLKKRYPHLQVIATDPSEPMLELARQKLLQAGLDADVRHGYLEDFEDIKELDAIVMIGVLHHLQDRRQQIALLRQCGSRLKSEGILIAGFQAGPMSDPLRRAAWEQRWRDCGISEDEIVQRRAKVAEIVALDISEFHSWLESSGFAHSERIFSSLFFEVWASLRR